MKWREKLALCLYSVGMRAAQPLLRRKLRKRAVQEPGYAEAIPERFGFYAVPTAGSSKPSSQPLIWIHAVSLGETRAASILLKTLRQHRPDWPVLLTHSTATGRAEGKRLLAEIGIPDDQQAWLPWDTTAAVARFLQHFQPSIGLLMETEVWPNLVQLCKNRHIPLWLINARLNEKSYKGALKFPSLAKPAYRNLAGVLAQTDEDGRRLAALGANIVQITGNLKFDEKPSATLLEQGRRWKVLHQQATARPIIALASSRDGEEAMWLDAIQATDDAQQVQWLVIPRHPQRFEHVKALIKSRGLPVSCRSDWATSAPPVQADVWLGDSMGEMALFYALADITLMGASFAPLGGQNLIEACVCGCPVIVGPHTFNFAQAASDAIKVGAAQRAENMQKAVEQAILLASNPQQLQIAQNQALEFAHSMGGASEKTAKIIIHQVLSSQ